MKAAETFPTKLKANRTSTATARRLRPAATGRMAIVRMAEIAVGVADVRAAAGVIVDAAGAAEGRAAAGGIVDAAGRAGGDTRNFLPRICTDSHGYKRGHGARRGLFLCDISRIVAGPGRSAVYGEIGNVPPIPGFPLTGLGPGSD